MPLKHKKFGHKSLLSNPIAIGAIALVVAIGVYFISGKSSSKKPSDQQAELEIKPSGLDKNDEVETVGEVEEVIAKWIEANPQAVIASLQNMQKRAAEEQMKNAQKSIGDKKDELFEDKNSPEYAPSKYDVTVVEFFDYACGYCKKANATIEKLLEGDKKIRVVYKEFPILGAPSIEMSTVAIAVNMVEPKSYRKFHNALMKSNERGKDGALKIAKEVGINVDKVISTISSKQEKIAEIIQSNLALGGSIGINGTPGFVIGDELIPGAFELDAFKEKVAKARD
jgi:protein-disulfide isomerase